MDISSILLKIHINLKPWYSAQMWFVIKRNIVVIVVQESSMYELFKYDIAKQTKRETKWTLMKFLLINKEHIPTYFHIHIYIHAETTLQRLSRRCTELATGCCCLLKGCLFLPVWLRKQDMPQTSTRW